MRIVLDTNVLVRCTKNAQGPARECFRRFETRRHTLLVSPYLLTELARVLSYPRLMAQHRLSPDEIGAFIASVEQVAEPVAMPQDALPAVVSSDPDDDLILLLAVVGKADILCTLDQHLRRPEVAVSCAGYGIRVLCDVELLRHFREDESRAEGNGSRDENDVSDPRDSPRDAGPPPGRADSSG